MFLFKAKTVLDDLEICPEILDYCKKSLRNSTCDLEFQRLNKSDFEKCPNVSFDVAIMEKTKKGIVLPLNAGWSDIGSWLSLWENSTKDINENYISGKNIFVKDAKNCYMKIDKRLIVGIGLDNLVVIDTDALDHG